MRHQPVEGAGAAVAREDRGGVALRGEARVARLAPLRFDLSTCDLFSSACRGAGVHLVGRKAAMFPAQLRSFLDDRAITVVYAVPSLLTMLVERGGIGRFPPGVAPAFATRASAG